MIIIQNDFLYEIINLKIYIQKIFIKKKNKFIYFIKKVSLKFRI